MAESIVEKRRHLRVSIVVRVTAISSGIVQTCLSNDIGPGGMFLETKEPFEIGELLSLEFSVPGISRMFNITGKVIRAVEEDPDRKEIVITGMGARFAELDQETERLIKNFVGEEG